jgi:hypothetical protein
MLHNNIHRNVFSLPNKFSQLSQSKEVSCSTKLQKEIFEMLAFLFLAVAIIANAEASISTLNQPSYLNLNITAGTLPGLRTGVYGKADAPRNVTSSASASGITVRWLPSLLCNPVVTSYIITGGPGSCPVTINAPSTGASSISLIMPVITGQTTVTVSGMFHQRLVHPVL